MTAAAFILEGVGSTVDAFHFYLSSHFYLSRIFMRGESLYCSFQLSFLRLGSLRLGLATLFVLLAGQIVSTQAVSAQERDENVGPTFAPGVLTTITPEVAYADTVSVHDLVEIQVNTRLTRDPKLDSKSQTLHEMAKSVQFRRDIWCLELSFKPLRMLLVDVPQPSGKMQRKLVWYMVYRVRNTGAGLSPEQQEDGTFLAREKVTESVRFYPQFVLTSQDLDRSGKRVRKAYLDRMMPSALQAIQKREMPSGKLLDSVEMSEHMLEVQAGRAVGGQWGVAIWEDVDPNIDFFSVFVGGLTNAYQWQDSPEDVKVGDPVGTGRRFTRKLLQLNFWRPGDAYAEEEREIRFGQAPGKADLYSSGAGVASRWVFR